MNSISSDITAAETGCLAQILGKYDDALLATSCGLIGQLILLVCARDMTLLARWCSFLRLLVMFDDRTNQVSS